MRGIITRLIPAQGFGFIRGDDGLSHFLHAKECAGGPATFDLLREGQTVEFETYMGPKGPRARDTQHVDPH